MDAPQQPLELKPGVERWPVKTGQDPMAISVNTTPVGATIEVLTSLSAPSDPDSIPDRLTPTEETVYEIEATLIAYKLEQDGDYHLVIQDDAGRTMIAEIPDPDFCEHSLWLSSITAARQAFDQHFSKQTAVLRQMMMAMPADAGVPMITKVSVPVKLTGVGFFDRLHGQTGVAPNGIELHPVLSIEFS